MLISLHGLVFLFALMQPYLVLIQTIQVGNVSLFVIGQHIIILIIVLEIVYLFVLEASLLIVILKLVFKDVMEKMHYIITDLKAIRLVEVYVMLDFLHKIRQDYV
jgi:hypothetical protein